MMTSQRLECVRNSMSTELLFLRENVRVILDTSYFQVCLDVTAKFPEPDWSKLQKIATFHEGKTVKTIANVHYGSNCVDQSSVRLISFERNILFLGFRLQPQLFPCRFPSRERSRIPMTTRRTSKQMPLGSPIASTGQRTTGCGIYTESAPSTRRRVFLSTTTA